MKKIITIKKIAYFLAALSLLTSLLPLPIIGGVSSVFADSEETTSPETSSTETGGQSEPQPAEQDSPSGETAGEADKIEQETMIEITEEWEEGEFQTSFTMMMSVEGPDPDGQAGSVRQKLPSAPGNDPTQYNNGLCNSNKDLCASASNVTKKMDNQWIQEFDLTNGETIIAINIKGGGTNDWQFFEKSAGNVCPQGALYCVEFTENNRVVITGNDCEIKGGGSNQRTECSGPNQIDFWNFAAEDNNDGDTGGDGEIWCEWNASILANDPNCVEPNDDDPVDEVCEWDTSLAASDLNCFDPNDDGEDDAGGIIVDPENPGGGSGSSSGGGAGGAGGSGGAGGAAAGLIPVMAPETSTEELVLIPVTGLDMATFWQASLFHLGLMLLGGALALEGFGRRKQAV